MPARLQGGGSMEDYRDASACHNRVDDLILCIALYGGDWKVRQPSLPLDRKSFVELRCTPSWGTRTPPSAAASETFAPVLLLLARGLTIEQRSRKS